MQANSWLKLNIVQTSLEAHSRASHNLQPYKSESFIPVLVNMNRGTEGMSLKGEIKFCTRVYPKVS